MSIDLRLDAGLFRHPKTRRLSRAQGPEGVIALLTLWCWTAEHRPDGDLKGLDDEEIGDFAGVTPERALEWVRDLAAIGWLDGPPGSRAVHGWIEHNAWAANRPKRIATARALASRRWSARDGHANGIAEGTTTGNAKEPPTHDATGNASGNAPSPSPSPSPLPSPKRGGSSVNRAPGRSPPPSMPKGQSPEKEPGTEVLGAKLADSLAEDPTTATKVVRELLAAGVSEEWLQSRIASTAEPIGAFTWKRLALTAWREASGNSPGDRDFAPKPPDSGGQRQLEELRSLRALVQRVQDAEVVSERDAMAAANAARKIPDLEAYLRAIGVDPVQA